MLPNNLPDANKKGCKKLHPTDATQNFGTFLPINQDPELAVVDYKDIAGYGDSLARKSAPPKTSQSQSPSQTKK